MPKFTKEIGDNWIRGVGTDPFKVAQLRSLMRLRNDWLRNRKSRPSKKLFHAFSRQLLLVTEHTWGLDEKTHLHDFTNYEKRSFERLRKTAAGHKMEQSWDEQRGYLRAAIAALGSTTYARNAQGTIEYCRAIPPDLSKYRPFDITKPLTSMHMRWQIDPQTGALAELTDFRNVDSPRRWADAQHLLGCVGYTTYSQADYDRYYRQYARDTHLHGGWILPDITKPGMPKDIRHQEWSARPVAAFYKEGVNPKGWRYEQTILVQLRFPAECSRRFGAPRNVYLQYEVFEDFAMIFMQLWWFDKPACRLPEALWLRFTPKTSSAARWRFEKLGLEIDPLQVAEHGGRQLHAIDKNIWCRDGHHQLRMHTTQAPLVAPGREDLIDFSTRQPSMKYGVRFNLYNNTWGTNFPMWYDDDAHFRFALCL